jgi:hypothetical protein
MKCAIIPNISVCTRELLSCDLNTHACICMFTRMLASIYMHTQVHRAFTTQYFISNLNGGMSKHEICLDCFELIC